jgi:hypothetical protein
VLGNVLNLTHRDERGLHLIGRRTRRRKAEAAEVAEIDQWLAQMRNGPELVLYPAHPQLARRFGRPRRARSGVPRSAAARAIASRRTGPWAGPRRPKRRGPWFLAVSRSSRGGRSDRRLTRGVERQAHGQRDRLAAVLAEDAVGDLGVGDRESRAGVVGIGSGQAQR